MTLRLQPASASRLGTPLVLGLALVLGMAAAWWFQNRVEERPGWRQHTAEVRVELASLKSDIMDLSRGQHGYAISGRAELDESAICHLRCPRFEATERKATPWPGSRSLTTNRS